MTPHVDFAASPPRSRAATLVVALAAASLLLFRLGSGPIHVDEALYLSIAHELATADRWFPPTYLGEFAVNKPPTGYWLLRAAFAAAGESLAAGRLPAAIAGIALVALLHAAAARWFGTMAAIFGTTAFLLAPGSLSNHALRGATFDAMTALLVTGACVAAIRSRVEDRPDLFRRAIGFVALSALFKGLAGPAFAAAVVFSTEIVGAPDGTGLRRRVATAARRAGVLLGTGILIWGLWLGALAASGVGALVDRLLVDDLIRRTLGSLHAAHQKPVWFYILRLQRDFGWALLALIPLASVAIGARAAPSSPVLPARLARMLLVWPTVLLVLLSLSSSKVSWYALPAWTGLALGLAAGLRVALASPSAAVRRVTVALALILLASRAVEAYRHLGWLSRHVQPGWQALERVRSELERRPSCRFHLVGGQSALRQAPTWVAFGVLRLENRVEGWPAPAGGGDCAFVLAPAEAPVPDFAERWPRQSGDLAPFVLLDGCGGCLSLREEPLADDAQTGARQ